MSIRSFKCYKCQKEIQTDIEPKKYVDESGFLGYICRDCFIAQKNRLKNSLICPKCNFNLRFVKANSKINKEINNEIWTHFEFICPNCKFPVSLKRKIGRKGCLEINSAMLEPYKDDSIKKVYELYEKGYKIIGTEVSYDTNKYTISLAKGNNTVDLNFSKVSVDFSRFFSKLQFVYDHNLRRIATLIEPNEYWGNSVAPKEIEGISIEISGFKINKIEILDLPKERSQNPLFRFKISLKEAENKNFLKVDYREPLICYTGNQIIFKGYIATIMRGFEILEVICNGMLGDILVDKINIAVNSKQGHSSEIIAFLLDYFEKPYTINGLDKELRNFELIIPVSGIKLSDNLNIGECYITKKPQNKDFFFQKNFPNERNYILLNLKRKSFFDAFIDGLRYIGVAINLINFRIKIPTYLDYYHHFDQRVKIHYGDVVYMLDKKHGTELIINLPLNKKPEFEQHYLINKFFEPIQDIADEIIKPNEEISVENEKLLWIFHYLISAESKTNRTEAFLDLCIALEFLMSRFGIKIKKKFTKDEFKTIRRYCNSFIIKKKEDLEKIIKEKKNSNEVFKEKLSRYELMQKRLIQLVNSNFNQPSLNDQLDILLISYNLELSEIEKGNFKSARQKRNAIIHGKQRVKPTKEEYNIVSKIIYFLIRNALIKESISKK
ncbi:MAG: hypothetical protein ACTSR7_19425 [Promethearchaeota archaeon]